MTDQTFYDNTPFDYGYSSRERIISSMHPLLKKAVSENKNKFIADIGCGCGRNLLYSSKFASKLIGIDLSKKSLDFAREFINNDDVVLILGNNLSIPLDDGSIDLVISDGVCHHTGDTFKAFSECIRILKRGGTLYLAVYKKFRYYPLIYYTLGFLFRILKRSKFGTLLLESFFVKIHYFFYKVFKTQNLNIIESRNIFYDYFLTPIATFQSKKDVMQWSEKNNCQIVEYDRTNGNCHIFLINKK